MPSHPDARLIITAVRLSYISDVIESVNLRLSCCPRAVTVAYGLLRKARESQKGSSGRPTSPGEEGPRQFVVGDANKRLAVGTIDRPAGISDRWTLLIGP
ncbi:hypothetical protein V2G26_008672 [Clonostachys chloroleuca]